MARVRIGLSGWSYPDWKDDFYEGVPRARWLEHVGRVFDTVEVNGSFYSLQKPSSYAGWYDATPASFRFAVKGSRFITHDKKLGDTEGALANFFASGVLALKEKLAPVLWQLPANQPFREERLRAFLEGLPRDFESAARLARGHDHRVEEPFLEVGANHRIRHAFEVRHESFLAPRAVRVLRDGGVALVVSDAGEWPLREELTAGFVYVRLHGSPHTYHSGYGARALDRWAERIRAWRDGGEPADPARVTDRAPPRRKGRDVFVYFDNDAGGRAPRDARDLADRVA